MIRVLRFVAACALAGAVAGCSTSDFAKPISDFSKATAEASTTFSSYADALDNLAYQQHLIDVAAGKKRLDDRDCNRSNLKRCKLLVSEGSVTEPLKPELLLNTRKVMAFISVYAENLVTIANADDVAKIKAAAEATPASVLALAKAIDEFNAQQQRQSTLAAQAGPLIEPIAQIATTALTQYVEAVKLEALRGATTRMERIFPSAMRAVSHVAMSNNEITKTAAFRKYLAAREVYVNAVLVKNESLEAAKKEPLITDDQKRARAKLISELNGNIKDTLEPYQAAADGYNAAIVSKPDQVFIKLGEAHSALVSALQSPEPDFRMVFGKIQEIGALVTTLAANAKKIEKALNSDVKQKS